MILLSLFEQFSHNIDASQILFLYYKRIGRKWVLTNWSLNDKPFLSVNLAHISMQEF